MRYPRNMIGYGENTPHANWPGNANIAVQFVLNYEEGGENNILHGDPVCEAFLSEIPGAVPWEGQRHWNMESIYEYGARAGFWRLHRLFTELNVPVTVFGVTTALMRSPEQLQAMQNADWEIACHGNKWVEHKDMPEALERQQVEEAVRGHEIATGEKPAGWYTGRCSLNTVDIVSEVGGFEYISDTYDDDLPYWRVHQDKPQLIIPYTLEANDMRFGTANGFNSGEQFFNYLKDSFDYLYAEGAAGRPKMFSIGLHCRLVGRAGRIAALKRFIEYVQSHDKVWIAKRVEIARHWAATQPYIVPKLAPSKLSKTEFLEKFGDCFRNGEAITERAFESELGPANDSPYGLFFALRCQFRAASLEEKKHILKAYTRLDDKIADAEIVADEKDARRIDAMTAKQQHRLLELLQAYKQKFGFDAIFVVRHYTTATLLAGLEERLLTDLATELAVTYREVEALAQIQVNERFAA